MQSVKDLRQALDDPENLDLSQAHAMNSEKGEKLAASKRCKSFTKGLQEICDRLRDNPEAQYIVAARQW